MVLVSFLFTNSIQAQSELDIGIARLNDEEKSSRYMATRTLGKLGDKRAVTSLTKALKDKSKRVRLAATLSLKWIKRGL